MKHFSPTTIRIKAGCYFLERHAYLKASWHPAAPIRLLSSLHYQLAPDTVKAEIDVRRVSNGRLMHHDTLRNGSTAYQLSLRGWLAGLYVVTLRVDGVPVKTTKLIVQ